MSSAAAGKRQRKCMDRAGKFFRQHSVNGPLAGHPRQAVEGSAAHFHAEVRFAAFAPAGMATMALTFVDHGQVVGGEC
jgi:hypothetical protein